MPKPELCGMIRTVGGNVDSDKALTAAIGRKIESIVCSDDGLLIGFAEGKSLQVVDDASSCCERRYMSCDDELESFIGGTLVSLSIEDAPDPEPEVEGKDHNVQFLHVRTSRGSFTVQTHNEHNGYYGGFDIRCHEVDA